MVDVSKFKWLAWWNIEEYFKMEDPTQIEPFGLETWVEGPVVGDIEVRGIIDRLVLDDDGNIIVQDYKTGKPHNPRYDEDKIFPLMIYAELASEEHQKPVSKMELLYLKDGSRREYEPTPENRENMYRIVTETHADMTEACNTGIFTTNKTKLCDWCDHKVVCPAWSK